VLEGLAAGVPVLASNRGGLPELAGEDAVLPASDSAAWSAALSELWESPQLRERRGEQALRRARRQFGEAGYYEQLTRLYDGISP
jgi:glycosyltransferase involved in cell wall biosynthesis